jgi:LmbE family N-acetylglucosaminyl deacetylase
VRRIADTLAGFEALPGGDVRAVLKGQQALILAPHPDDESLGCGGLIAAACEAGLAPVVAVLTDGAASHPGSGRYPPPRLAAVREAETRNAAREFGLPPENLVFLRYGDTALPAAGDGFDAACGRVARIAAERGCGVLVAPWGCDPHCDHQAAALIAGAVAARQGLRLLSYPVWGWLRDGADMVREGRGGWRLDISAQLAAKQRAIAAHVSQYGGLITDSPGGFQLPAALLAVFARPYEVFLE